MSDLTTADITTGTELVYQGPSVDFTNDRDYRPAVRGTVVDIVEETKHLVSDTIEQTMVVIETEDDEKRIDIDNLVGETDFRVGVVDGGDEEDEDEDENEETEIVTDGGEDITGHVDDDTIEAAIEAHDGPLDHDQTATVDEIRDALAWVQQSVTEHWSDWLSDVENGESTVVYEDGDVIVFATGQDNVPRRDLRDYYEGDLSERTPDVVSAIHHELARNLCDYDWGYEYPLVVAKPDSFAAGQEYVEAVVNSLQQRGLSPGQAWAYYGVEIRDNSRNAWGRRKGDHDHKNVSDALEKAKRKLP